jgi:hypothetical protein
LKADILHRCDPLNTCHSVKRLIGRQFADIATLAATLSYAVAADKDGNVIIDSPAVGLVTPDEASAEILKVWEPLAPSISLYFDPISIPVHRTKPKHPAVHSVNTTFWPSN